LALPHENHGAAVGAPEAIYELGVVFEVLIE
jgi:hypothetical protein